MQRPRNRQNRAPQPNSRGRGRGRGQSRGGGRSEGFQRQTHEDYDSTQPSNIPTIRQVRAGAFVSMVLKVDQPTGREVQGIVADVLTSGNHPRGIKVRLRDGRVGRVQRMISEEEARAGSEGLRNLGRNGEVVGTASDLESRLQSRPPRPGRIRYRDVREEEEPGLPSSGFSLGDFLPSEVPRMDCADEPAAIVSGSEERTDFASATRMCPVCEAFEGDDAAVAHHVNSHFGD
ncbi:MAG: hypothetical protein M1818_001375 [Claussenomyces sp. TS43310]|nr:MAG: hypothetical protein M1818_001375 [Claussenomyces sp. TS43310]